MGIELVHPPWHPFPSGGNVYNRSLVATARQAGLPLVSVEMRPQNIARHFLEVCTHFRLWDSLFLETLAQQPLAGQRNWGILLHYLPSRDPTVAAARRRHLESIEMQVVEAAGLVIATGTSLETILRRRHPHRPIFLCEPGVSPVFSRLAGKRRATSDSDVELITVANLQRAKGQLDVLPCLAKQAAISWHWHLIGDDGRDPQYTRCFWAAAGQLGIASRITRHGRLEQPAIADLMARADLFVFPSQYESYGMALAEAAASGLPAVATRVGAAERLFPHGRAGLLAPAGDLTVFARHLHVLMEDAELRRRFRVALRDFRARTWQDTVRDFMLAWHRSRAGMCL